MISCTLQPDQIRDLRRKIAKDLLNALASDKNFDVREYLNGIYDIVYEASNKDENKALDYVRMSSNILGQIVTIKIKEYGGILSKGLNLQTLAQQNIAFSNESTGLQSVKDIIKEKVTKKELSEISDSEEINKKIEEEEVEGSKTVTSNFDRPRPATPISTTIDELAVPGNDSFGANPEMAFYTIFVKNTLKFFGVDSSRYSGSLPYKGVEGGIFVSLVRYNRIPVDQLNPKFNREDIENNALYETGYAYVLTDKDGNFLKFNDKYDIDDKGKVIHFDSRFLPLKETDGPRKGKFKLTNVLNNQNVIELSLNLKITVDQAYDILQSQFEELERAYRYLDANPTESIMYTIDGGSFGGMPLSQSKFTSVEEIDFENMPYSVKYMSKEDMAKEMQGDSYAGYYVFTPKSPIPLALKLNKLKAEDVNTVYDLLFKTVYDSTSDKPLSAQAKLKLIGDYIALSGKNYNIQVLNDTDFRIVYNGEIINTGEKASITDTTTEKVKEMLGGLKYKVQAKAINERSGVSLATLKSKDSDGKLVVSLKSFSSERYIGMISEIKAPLDAQNKIITYNPYFTLKAAPEQLKKLHTSTGNQTTTTPAPSSVADVELTADKVLEILTETSKKFGIVELYKDNSEYIDKGYIVEQIKNILNTLGLPYKDVVAIRHSTYHVINSKGESIEILKLLQVGGAPLPAKLTAAKYLNSLTKEEKINYAKKQLAASEGKKETPESAQTPVSSVKPTIDLSREWKGDLESSDVYTKGAVNTMRTKSAKPNEHFGNPWSEGGYAGTIKTGSVAEAAQNYKDWLLGTKFQEVKPEQRKWILDQINQGKLDGAKLLYSKKLMDRGQGSHATSLAEVVEQLRSAQAPATEIKGINISTKSPDKLGRELTNPNWGAKYIMDIEAEYKANASRKKAPNLNAQEALIYDMDLMYKLQMKKFKAHPELVKEITDRGGVAFLEASRHIPIRDNKETINPNSRWEGKGTNSNFIKVLIRSYQDSLQTAQASVSSVEKGFKLSIDKKGKDQGKANLANRFIGYGVSGTSTYQYEQDAKKAGVPVNYEGTIDETTVAFVSVNGNNKASEKAIFETIENAREVLEAGGTVIMDSTQDANRSWNKNGEALVQEGLGEPSGQTSKGYNYWGKNPETTQAPVNTKAQEAINTAKPVVDENAGKSSSDNNAIDALINKNSDLLNRLRNKLDNQTNVEATRSQIREAKRWYLNSPLFSKPVDASKVDKSKVKDKKDATNTGDVFLEKGQYRQVLIPFKVAFNVINTKTRGSIATWDQNGITLFKGANYSDLYHEAWHGFTQMFLTQQQRDSLYESVRKQKGTFVTFEGKTVEYKDATKIELEEKLAEDFREYMLSKGTSSKKMDPVKKTIFDYILDILNLLFSRSTVEDIKDNGMNNPIVNTMYENLRVGNLVDYTFNQANAEFTTLNKTLIPFDAGIDEPNTLSRHDATLLSNSVDGLIIKLIKELNARYNTKAYTTSLMRSKEGRSLVYSYVQDSIADRLIELMEYRNRIVETDPEIGSPELDVVAETDYNIELLSYALRHFGDSNNPDNTYGLVDYHARNSELIAFEDLSIDESEVSNEKNQFESRAGNETSMKGLADSSLLYIIKSLQDVKLVDGRPVVATNSLGFPSPGNFDKAWNRIVNISEGARNVDEIYEKLSLAKEDYAVIAEFLEMVGPPNSMETSVQNLWTQIEKVLTMPRISLVTLRVKITKTKSDPNDKYSKVLKSVIITPSTATGEYSKVGRKWNTDFALNTTNPFIVKNPDTGINELNVSGIVQKYSDITMNNVYQFMQDIGMPLENSKISREALKDPQTGITKDIKKIINALKDINAYNQIISPTNPIVISSPTSILKEFKLEVDMSSLNDSQKKRLKGIRVGLGGSNTSLKAIEQFQLKWSDSFTDTTVSNAENNNQYERSLRSTISNQIADINAADNIITLTQDGVVNSQDYSMNHLSKNRNPFMKTSIIMRRLFDSAGNKIYNIDKNNKTIYSSIELTNMSGLSREIAQVNGLIENSGIASSNSDAQTKYLQDMYMTLLYGAAEAARHADKSTTLLYRLMDAMGRKHFIDLTSFGVSATDTNISDGKAKFVKLLTQYLGSEYERIARLTIGDDAYVYTDSANAKVGKKTYKEVGSEFVVFDKILDATTKKKLKGFLENEVLTQEDFAKELNTPENVELLNSIEQQIGNYLSSMVQEATDTLEVMQFYTNDQLVNQAIKPLLGYRTSQNKDDKPIKETLANISDERKKELVNSFVEAYVANAWVHKFEFSNLLYGDAALHDHSSDAYTKRIPGAAATGDFMRLDSHMLNYINSKLQQHSYARAKGYALNTFLNEMNTAVLQDTSSKSIYLDDYIEYAKAKTRERLQNLNKTEAEINKAVDDISKTFEEAYDGMKEGDGQGWMAFDAYRAVLMGLDKWSNAQEELYIKIINGENVDDYDVVKFFPIKKFQYYGPLKTEGLPVYGYHKFSLMPLIPNLVANTPLETLHNKMMEQNIGYSLFLSGSKLNSITNEGVTDKFYNNPKSTDDISVAFQDPDYQFSKNTIFLKYFKDQVEVADYYKGKNTFSTQMRTLLEQGLMSEGVPTDWAPEIKDPETRYNEWAKVENKLAASKNYRDAIEYENNLRDLVNFDKEKLREEMGNDPRKIAEFLQKEMTRKEMMEHEIEFVDYDGRTNSFKNTLDLAMNRENIERMLVALAQKRVLNSKVTGESLVQVSGAGFEKFNVRFENFSDTTQRKDAFGTRGLPFYRRVPGGKTKAMKIKISMQGGFKNLLKLKDVKDLVKQRNNEITELEALNILIQDEQWLDQNNGNNRKLIRSAAVRIPVQGHNSFEFMEVFEFLPETSGNMIVLPAEIVGKSGGDFDIDKLFTMFPSLKSRSVVSQNTIDLIYSETGETVTSKDIKRINRLVEEEKAEGKELLNEKERAIYNVFDEFGYFEDVVELETEGRKGIENKIIDNIFEILSSEDNFLSLITPNTTRNLAGIAKDMNKKLEGAKTIVSPTEIYEIGRNLYKHQSNSIGKFVLGIVAVNNVFNSIFARTGLVLSPTRIVASTELGDYSGPQRLGLPHNTINGNISLSALYSKDGITKISDMISQLINGSVDVAKDAWIFDLNAQKEVIPVMLFMLQAGVSPENIALFVNQPIIRDYVKAIGSQKTKFNELIQGEDPGNLFKIKARDSIIMKLGYDKADFQHKRKDRLEKWKLMPEVNEVVNEAIANKYFDKENLEKNLDRDIKNKNQDRLYSEIDKAVFMHFIEINDMANQITELTTNLSYDTKRLSTLQEISNSVDYVKGDIFDDIFDDIVGQSSSLFNGISKESIEAIINNSPKGVYNIREYILDLFKDLFPLESDKTYNGFVNNNLNPSSLQKRLNMDTPGEVIELFKKDFFSFLFQNNYYKFNRKSYFYNGVDISYEVKKVSSLTVGAAYKDGVLYVDKKVLEDSFLDGSYSRDTKDRTSQGSKTAWSMSVAPVDAAIFNIYSDNHKGEGPTTTKEKKNSVAMDLYFKYVYQREINRNLDIYSFENISNTREFKAYKTELSTDPKADLKAYEMVLRDRTLDGLNYHGHMFFGNNAYALQILNLKRFYPDMFKKYLILDNMSVETSEVTVGGFKRQMSNLAIKGLQEKDDMDTMYSDLMELMDPSVVKVSDPLENARISDMFQRFTHYALLQSGLNTTSTLSLVRYGSNEKYLDLVKPYYDEFIAMEEGSPRKEMMLYEYLELFKKQNDKKNGKFKNKLKFYVAPKSGDAKENEDFVRVTSEDNLNTIHDENPKHITKILRGKKKQNFDITIADGKTVTIKGYGVRFPEFPDIDEFIVSNVNYGDPENLKIEKNFYVLMKSKNLIVPTTKTKLSDILEDVLDVFNRELANEKGRKVLVDLGFNSPEIINSPFGSQVSPHKNLSGEELSKLFTVVVENNTGSMLYSYATYTSLTKKGVEALQKAFPSVRFVYNEIVGGKKNEAGNNSAYRNMENAFPITTKLGSSPTNPSNQLNSNDVLTDDTYDANIEQIEKELMEIYASYEKGDIIAFDYRGYGQYMIGYSEYNPFTNTPSFTPVAPRTFNYLSKRMYELFKFINPNYLSTVEGRRVVQSYQPVTDEEVYEQKKSCKLT